MDFEEEQEMQPKPESFSTAYAETLDKRLLKSFSWGS